jgi:outer membrane protein OmpA-like peptidoglycan-associated protein
VLVKGHAALDDFADDSNAARKMDLSLRRAQAVADYLVSKGVSPDIVRVQGCSTFEPVAQRAYSTTAQTSNRRVEVEVTSTLVQELQDPQKRARPTSSPAPAPAKTEEHGSGH